MSLPAADLSQGGAAGDREPVVVTGAAGFIGHHVCHRLLADGYDVLGIDSLNDYYDVQLKRDRVAELSGDPAFRFVQQDITEPGRFAALLEAHGARRVVHLAAQVGVRYSLTDPDAYVQSNVAGFTKVLEACRKAELEHLVFASSSSVYGLNQRVPFEERHAVDHPASLYAATKRANELMAHVWAHLYGLPITGLRFFTVYGPWGRPDMALHRFTEAILTGAPLQVFNNGDMQRDFTYVDDVVESVVRLLHRPPAADASRTSDAPDQSPAPFHLFNVGNNAPVQLMDFIRTIEAATGREAKLELRPMQPGDVHTTYADSSALARWVGFAPSTSLAYGVGRYVEWFRSYYGL